MTMPSGRFIFIFCCLGLAACAGYAALVLHSASWAEARQLDAIFPFYTWRIRSFSAPELARAWQWLAGVAAIMGLHGVLAATAAGRAEMTATWHEVGQVLTGARRIFTQLTPRQRWLSSGALASLTALRGWLSRPDITPAYDDVASYELFASKPLLAVAGYYPIPNNHVLANTLSWVFYHVNPGFWFTMRLPVLLAATAGTVLLFGGLRWARVGFRAAVLATLLFSLSGLALYHAAVGRGYWLVTALAGLVFFCTLALTAAPRYARAAWVGLVGGTVLGLYTVPTFALVGASAFSWVALGAIRHRQPRVLAALLGLGGVVAAGSLLLYAPLLFVSGPASLFANGFVTAHTLPQFWAGLPAYLWRTEGALAGQMTVGALLVLPTLGAAVFIQRHAAARFLTPAAWQRLVPAAGWFMLLPYGVLAGRHVFAPERTLLYKGFFFFVLLALVIDYYLSTKRTTSKKWLRPLLAGLTLLWAGYQLLSLARDSRALRQRNAAFHEAFRWLDGQLRGPLLVPESTHSLFLRMYQHAERPGQHWPIDALPQPGVRYRYVVAFPDQRGLFQPRFAAPPIFHNPQVVIYQPTTTTAPPAPGPPAYWHLAD